MEGNLQSCPQFACSIDIDDLCSPSPILEERLVEAKRAAEDDWETKESSLLRQIEDLHFKRWHAQQQIQQLYFSLEQSITRLMNTEQLLHECERENKNLLDKLESFSELKEELREKTSALAKGKEMQDRLSRQIELKDDELLVERGKRRSLFKEYRTRYKGLKSRYDVLLKNTWNNGRTVDNKPHPARKEEITVLSVPFQSRRSPHDEGFNGLASKPSEMKTESDFQEKLDADRSSAITRNSNADSHMNLSSYSASLPPKLIAGDVRSESSGSLKRAAACWRETQVWQKPRFADPHDDFLDTPMEVARNLNTGPREQVQDFPVPASKDMDFNNPDDKTEVMDVETAPPKQQILTLSPVSKGFKYVEPGRKRSERESLEGAECKPCNQFYDAADAILPDGGIGGDGNTTNGYSRMRCDHRDSVSRHRYRYAPPTTLEGFWNIGLESEM